MSLKLARRRPRRGFTLMEVLLVLVIPIVLFQRQQQNEREAGR